MTSNYFENQFVKLHYYKYGTGSNHLLCFHGFGMHGKQFRALTETFGDKYTFWGFDLFFHKQTLLKDQSLATVKKGLQKTELAALIQDFCSHENIRRFSVIGYSMGSHYATTVVEQLPQMVNEYIVAAPSSIEPGSLIRFFGKNKIGNKILEKLVLSENGMARLIRLFKRLRFIDETGSNILNKEIETPQLRFALYACFTYLRHLETNETQLISVLRQYNIRSIFIFGKYDKMYLPKIGQSFFAKFKQAEIVILDEDHEMIKADFVSALARLLL
jgi:pimeloyl-ACP methyl ester carboxylesterase